MPPRWRGSRSPLLHESSARYNVESCHKLDSPCASKEEFQRWVTSHFKQEKKVVKLVWGPVTQDSDSEEVTFTAYAYCKQHVTQENEPCKVSWKVEWKEGMMQVARIAEVSSTGSETRAKPRMPLRSTTFSLDRTYAHSPLYGISECSDDESYTDVDELYTGTPRSAATDRPAAAPAKEEAPRRKAPCRTRARPPARAHVHVPKLILNTK